MRRRAHGIVLVALLLAIAFASVVALLGAESWATAVKREREAELLFAGDQYRAAIRHYFYGAPPGQPRVLPARLQDLLVDDRYPVPVQHLRRLYPDPVTGDPEWQLVTQGDRIAGVHSASDQAPLKQTGFAPANAAFEKSESYRSWVFMFAVFGGGYALAYFLRKEWL